MGRKIACLILTLGILLVAFSKPLTTHLSVLLLVSQEFPQIKIKPLHWLTGEPRHESLELKNLNGNLVVVDIFYPSTRFARSGQVSRTYPAVILTMGVKTSEKDKPIMLGFANTLARLGYIVVWPRLKVLDQGISQMEEPETFITSFEYLEKDPLVLPKRISFVGFSIGSSIAMVAAQEPQISGKVHAFVFFGGYYDIFDYLVSLTTKTAYFEDEQQEWEPAEGATSHLREILETAKNPRLLKIFEVQPEEPGVRQILETLPIEDRKMLEKINPAKNINNFKARIFILHERGDTYVPYLESQKLNQALEGRVAKKYLLVSLFEHVQPKEKVSFRALGEFLKLYWFIAGVLEFL